MDKDWFSLKDIRRRRLGDAVWVPLWVSEPLIDKGEYGHTGYVHEYYGVSSIAVPLARRDQAKALRWRDLGGHNQGIWATKDYYKPAEVYQHNDKEDLGIELVLMQKFETEDPNEAHLNQDLVFALGLKREGDVWLKPNEDYAPVARLRRGADGLVVAVEIKNDFLRDYLCARHMFLRTSLYRQRAVTVADPAEAGSPEAIQEESEHEQFELRVNTMVEGGHFGDASYAVFHVGRNDVSEDDDVPVPGPETDENTDLKSWTGKHEGRQLTYIEGALWRDEDVEPAETSIRVRGDKVPTGLQFIVDAAGNRNTSEELDDEDNARWLWFRPEVIPAITDRRSGSFRWYTMDTGGVGLSGSSLTHFGINSIGLINIYAYDIAKLPAWQQQVWAGYNVVPDGKVSAELLSAQMRAVVAETTAPEHELPVVMERLDANFRRAIGYALFRPHAETSTIIARISRFRALTRGGLFALAKDLMRVVADQIDTVALQKVVPPPKGETWRSLKTLENFLAKLVPADTARALVGPLAGAYDLRLADAHMPKAELESAFRLARVDSAALPIEQGFRLVASVVSALIAINAVLEAHLAKPGTDAT